MVLIVIYNILVNPFGRKFVFKHRGLRENLEGCLSLENCGDIIGAALHIINIFVDDFIDDNDMVSVLMYQVKYLFFTLQTILFASTKISAAFQTSLFVEQNLS